MNSVCPLRVAIVAALLIACAPAFAAGDGLQKLSWLSGCWSSDNGETGSGEYWMPLAGGSLVGVGRTVKGGKTVASELMRIEANASGVLQFTAVPLGQSTTAFSLLRQDASEVVFENLKNDFPHRIAYRRVDGNHVHARIEGNNSKGEPRTIAFPLSRSACEASAALPSRPSGR